MISVTRREFPCMRSAGQITEAGIVETRAPGMLAALPAPIAVVAHDAGAANLISAWFGDSPRSNVHGNFAGPATEIFIRQCGWRSDKHFGEVMPKCNTLISGTGWASAFEHDARKLAKRAGMLSIAVIDHWTDYRARFIRDDELILPDRIWVADEFAKEMAESEFPGIPVVQQHNSYLENLVSEVRGHEGKRTASAGANILYVLEPIRQSWGGSELAGEFQALNFFVANLDALCLGATPSIKLRPHPSDVAGKYDQWIKSRTGLNVTLESSTTLAESIAWADVVVGCQTYAMVVALAAGKRVISSIPSWAPNCILPQAGIEKLADFAE